MLLNNFYKYTTKTHKWILPIVLFVYPKLKEFLESTYIIGVVLGDSKHKIEVSNNKLLIIISSKGKYNKETFSFEHTENNVLDKLTEYKLDFYQYFNEDNDLLYVIKIDLHALNQDYKIMIRDIQNSQYSKLRLIGYNLLSRIYTADILGIINKNFTAYQSFKSLAEAKTGENLNNVTFAEYEFNFDLSKEILYQDASEIEEVNIREFFNDNRDKNKLVKDIKKVLAERFTLDDKIEIHSIEIRPKLLQHVLSFLELEE